MDMLLLAMHLRALLLTCVSVVVGLTRCICSLVSLPSHDLSSFSYKAVFLHIHAGPILRSRLQCRSVAMCGFVMFNCISCVNKTGVSRVAWPLALLYSAVACWLLVHSCVRVVCVSPLFHRNASDRSVSLTFPTITLSYDMGSSVLACLFVECLLIWLIG